MAQSDKLLMYSEKLQKQCLVEVLADDVGRFLDGRPFQLVMDDDGEEYLALPVVGSDSTVKGIKGVGLVHAFHFDRGGAYEDAYNHIYAIAPEEAVAKEDWRGQV